MYRDLIYKSQMKQVQLPFFVDINNSKRALTQLVMPMPPTYNYNVVIIYMGTKNKNSDIFNGILL